MRASNRSGRIVLSAVTAAAAAMWIGGVAGCSSNNGGTDADYVSVCEDPATGQRVEDDKCPPEHGRTTSSGPRWVYMPVSRSARAPAVGDRVPSGYTDSAPSSGKVTGANRSGGSFSKSSGTKHGGFGSGSKGGSGS